MKRISRRNFLKVAGVGAAALGLAACGGSSSSTASSTASSAAASAAPAEDVTIKVAAIETGYGADMWKKVTEAFTAQTGIKVELTTDKKLEDVIGPSMQGGDYPDVIHLATGREAALTEGERDETIDQLQTEVDKLTAELNAQTDLTLTYAGAFSCTAYCSED